MRANSFGNALRTGLVVDSKHTHTENGMRAKNSTGDSLVDLFGKIGSMRNRTDSEIESALSKAFSEDRLLATKMTFYARNIRDHTGEGERRTARVMWHWLAVTYPNVMRHNITNIIACGRWDDNGM